jgi:hypothetical protein
MPLLPPRRRVALRPARTEAPDEGDVLRRNGDNWVVEKVHEDDDGNTVVTLRPQPLLEPEPEPE